jgi:hypothetical protein
MRADALWVKPIVAINERRKAVAMAPAILIMGEQACSSLPVLTAEPREWG